MRIPYWIAAFAAVLGVGLTGGYYLALYIQEEYAALLASAIIFGVLTWLGSATDLLGFIRDWWKDKKEGEKSIKVKLRTHTKNLCNEVFKKLLDVQLNLNKDQKMRCEVPADAKEYHEYVFTFMFDQTKPRPQFIPVDSLPYFNRAISHLQHQSYKKIFDAWTNLHDIAKEYELLNTEIYDELNTAIKTKMSRHFPTFSEGKSGFQTMRDNYYYVKRISDFLIYTVLWFAQEAKSPRFDHLKKMEAAGRWVITGNDEILMHGQSEVDVDRELLQRVMYEITEDQALIEKIKQWQFVMMTKRMAAEQTFKAYLKELIEDIEDIEDDYLIAGECERCPKE